MTQTLETRQSGLTSRNLAGGTRYDRRGLADRRKPPAERLNQVEADLRQSSGLLRFSSETEKVFEQVRQSRGTQHYVWTSLAGLLIYDLYLFSDALMVPDILRRSIAIHIAVTVFSLLVVYLIHRGKVRTESIMAVLLMIVGNGIYASYASRTPNAVFVFFSIPLLVIFGNIVLPLPFRHAVVFSALSISAVSTAIWVRPGLDTPARIYAIFLEIGVGIYTLIATYRIEKGERQAYLLTLREMLRGETLVEQNRELSELSETDGLTGIANRRVFDRNLERLWHDHQQSRTPLALLLIDIDHFKRLNDTHGHANGDVCLRKVADRLNRLMHAHQSLARYGGEEFAVLLEGEGAYRAEAVAERLRAEIEIMPVVLAGSDNKPHHITISIGCATAIPRIGLSPAELFVAADKSLYEAKDSGRNRVHAQTLEPARGSRASDARPAPAAIFDPVAKN